MSQTILHKNQRVNYTHIDNELLNDERLSHRAVGLAARLLSKPNDWIIRIEWLAKTFPEGREAVRTALKELAEYGYMMRLRETDDEGNIRTITRIADYPAYADIGTVDNRINGYGYDPDPPETRRSGKPTPQKPVGRENRRSENPQVIVSTDLPNTDLPKKETPTTAAVWALWQENMPGMLTPILVDQVNDLIQETSEQSVMEGIKVAVANGARKLSYVAGVARRHASGAGAPSKANGTHKEPTWAEVFANQNVPDYMKE